MAAAIEEQSYVELRNKVKHVMARALQAHVITIEEVAAMLFIFEKAETFTELEAFIEIFSEAFPILQKFGEEKQAQAKGALEEIVKKVVGKLVKKDPLKATQIAKAALKPGITWEELVKEFPELNEE